MPSKNKQTKNKKRSKRHAGENNKPVDRPSRDKLSTDKAVSTEWVYGFHSAQSRLSHAPQTVIHAYLDERRRDSRAQKVIQHLQSNHIPFDLLSKSKLFDLVNGANHQGVVLKAKPIAQKPEKALYELLDALDHPPFILVLDQVTDPHNLGACLRTAEGAGVDAVILPKDGSCPLSETVRRTASGAAESMNVFYVTNLSRALKELKQRGIWLIGLADSAQQNMYESSISTPSAIIMGAEGKGLRKLTEQRCDQLVSIPMMGNVSSLNVSVATGLILYHARYSSTAP